MKTPSWALLTDALSLTLCALILTSWFAGCSTTSAGMDRLSIPHHERPNPDYYAGVKLLAKEWPEAWREEAPGGPGWTPVRRVYLIGFYLVDMPLSATMDTVLVPLDFVRRVYNGPNPEQGNGPGSTHR